MSAIRFNKYLKFLILFKILLFQLYFIVSSCSCTYKTAALAAVVNKLQRGHRKIEISTIVCDVFLLVFVLSLLAMFFRIDSCLLCKKWRPKKYNTVCWVGGEFFSMKSYHVEDLLNSIIFKTQFVLNHVLYK